MPIGLFSSVLRGIYPIAVPLTDEHSLALAASAKPPRSILSSHGCFYCIGAHMDRLLELYEISDADKRAFVEKVVGCYSAQGKRMLPMEFTRELYHLLRDCFPNQSPFWSYKRRMNDRALELNSLLKARVQICSSSFDASLRIALAGTAIDFLHDSDAALWEKVDRFLRGDIPIDHSKLLRSRMHSNARILYLGGQAGEIVFDRLFIRRIPSNCKVIYVVNCHSAGLSASGQDADYVDMRLCADVLANGCEAPHTLVQHGSERFAQAWEHADIIITKGQGNLESVYPIEDPRIFSFFTCKCNVVSKLFGLPVGSSALLNIEHRLSELARGSVA